MADTAAVVQEADGREVELVHPPRSLSEIRAPIQNELDSFRQYFRGAVRTDVALLDRVMRYLLRQKGKEIRPTLVLLSAESCGGVSEATYRCSVSGSGRGRWKEIWTNFSMKR